MSAPSLAPELGLIMEKFFSLSETVIDNWDDETAETTPEIIVKAVQQLYDMMASVSVDDLHLQQDIDIDQCCDYGLHLLDEQSELAARCGMQQVAEEIEDLCFPFSLWAARNNAGLHHLRPVVNAIARKANTQLDPGIFSSLFTQINEIMEAIDEGVRQDIESNDPAHPWRILLLNRAIIATRSFQPVLIDTAYMDIVTFLPQDASGFFSNAMEQMDLVGYPNHVKEIVETWFQRYSSKPTLH
jgi:hypothetical protein